MEKRERFGSRLGFVLVSAGCAVGLGNVWKFPYMCGRYGGALFILVYLLFLVALGLPIMLCEFAVGRGGQKSGGAAFRALQPKGTTWHRLGFIGTGGCYLLMMFYAMVGGWMLYYVYLSAVGHFDGVGMETVQSTYQGMLADPWAMMLCTVITVAVSFFVCLLGMQKGVERVSKVMMLCMFLLMGVLAVHAVCLPGAGEGIRFYLVPDFSKITEIGLGQIVFGAMSQAFFTLSLGIGSMAIFGSYLDKKRSLLGESLQICALDTLVALLSGLIVIPSCFAFGVSPDAGPGLIFVTLPGVFANMAGGRIWGTLFFLFLAFAAFTTIIAVFENIVTYWRDAHGWSRRRAVLVNMAALTLLSLPCIFGFNYLSGFQPLGFGSNIMDLEDFIVSYNLLPLGSLVYLLFCVRKSGWGFDGFLAEVNAGEGMRLSRRLRAYLTYVLPAVVVVIYLRGYYDTFVGKDLWLFAVWGVFALALLSFITYNVFRRPRAVT